MQKHWSLCELKLHGRLAGLGMKRKHRAETEKHFSEQHLRSKLIFEGQEEERNRIAMDIHDGIGQMLTSVKYQLESIDVSSGEKAREKISEVNEMVKQVIREVRRVTFNLKPTVPGEFGLQHALNAFVRETARLVDPKLVYTTSGKIDRLPQKTETHVFRIIQEAINNAVKHSGAERIEVSLTQKAGSLVTTVKDEGKGFDMRHVEARRTNTGSGHGLFNMHERAEYVNGQLRIQSGPHQGTTVSLTVPLENMQPADEWGNG